MLAKYAKVVVLTGAGISRSAGLATYRGPGGLWSDPKKAELSHKSALIHRRAEVCAMFWQFKRAVQDAEPTAAHRALAAFERSHPGMLIVTQNVDSLHQRAGSANVCEFHGTLARWRCDECKIVDAERATSDAPPQHCNEVMRPEVVMFGEDIPVAAEHAAKRALRECDCFVAIGTSGTVFPAASFVQWARYAGARTIYLNLEPPDEAANFDVIDTGTADELVPKWFAV